jgi:lipid-A-disaccharide synthase
MSRRVFITVGEVSGDANAAKLARELKKLDPNILIEGHGGPAMREAGVLIHRDTVGRAAMGLKAVLRAAEIRKLLAWTKARFEKLPPDLHVCVDSWSMNWHFARLAKQAGKPVLYYIAPQAWASRPGRVKRLRKYVDHLACILPFEKEWFSSRGVRTTYVGHPLFDRIPEQALPPARHFPTVGLLPGSRSGVARANFPPLLDAAEAIARAFPTVRFVVPTTRNTDAIVRDEVDRRGRLERFTVALDGFDRLAPRCDLCLTVSGTAALHLAAYNVPMIVVYRGNWLLWNMVGRWIITARTFSLVNILSPTGKKIAPEFIPWHGPAKPLANCALDYLRHPEKLAEQRKQLAEMIAPLNVPGASAKAAQLALDLMNNTPQTVKENERRDAETPRRSPDLAAPLQEPPSPPQ